MKTIDFNFLIKKVKDNKKVSIIILVGIILLLLFFVFFKTNKFYEDDVFWYLTDNNTTLHLSSTKPNDPNYKSGQNNFIKYKLSCIKNYGYGSDSTGIVFRKKKLFSKEYDIDHPIQFEKVAKSPIFYVSNVVIDNEIMPEYFSFSLLKDVTNIENLYNFNTSKMTRMFGMFDFCESLINIDLSNFNTENVTSMNSMFSGCKSLKSLDLSSLNTENVTDMSSMFNWCNSLTYLNVSSFDTSNVKNMYQMFRGCKSLETLDLSKFDTNNVTNMEGMFSSCENLYSLNISFFNNKNVKSYNMGGMFRNCKKLHTIYCNNDFVNDSEYRRSMFENCESLVGGYGTAFDSKKDTIEYAVVDSAYKNGYFTATGTTKKPKKYKDTISGLPRVQSEYGDDGHFYLDSNMQKSTWVYYVTNYYHVDGSGNIEKNKWIEKRYVGDDGKMYRGRQTPDGKWVGDDGLVVDVNNDLSKSLTIEGAEPDSWYRTQSGLWYYFENDRTTTKKGWFTDNRDDQTYYFDPDTGIMAVGWTTINGENYYFNESHDNENNWYETGDGFYESYGKKTKAYGSMFRNEATPAGYNVDRDGKLIHEAKTQENSNIMEKTNDDAIATIEIANYGTLKIQLDKNNAPITVENFKKLAREGFYDGLTFHRIISGFMIQGGDPLGTGEGGSKETIKGEFLNNGVENNLSHTRGVISMARANDPNSASSQFFIVHEDSDFLDGNYAAFGKVISGMDVVDKICETIVAIDDNGTVLKENQPIINKITISNE